MDQAWIIATLAVVAHLQLVLSFFPSYWEPVRRLGRRFSTLSLLFLIPLGFAALLVIALVDHWSSLADPIRLLGTLGIGASSATLVLNTVRLRALGSDSH